MFIYRLFYVFLILAQCISSGIAHEPRLHDVTRTFEEISESLTDDHDSHESVEGSVTCGKKYVSSRGQHYIRATATASVHTEERIKELDQLTVGSYWVYGSTFSWVTYQSAYDSLCGTYEGTIDRSVYVWNVFHKPNETIGKIEVEGHADVYNQTLNPETGQAYCEITI